MSQLIIEQAPVLTLSNGIVIANFSSPHEFNFEDGCVLAACSKERSSSFNLGNDDNLHETTLPSGKNVVFVEKRFKLTQDILDGLDALQDESTVDIVLVPLPVLLLLREQGLLERYSKAATVFTVDRLSKAASIQRFCR